MDEQKISIVVYVDGRESAPVSGELKIPSVQRLIKYYEV